MRVQTYFKVFDKNLSEFGYPFQVGKEYTMESCKRRDYFLVSQYLYNVLKLYNKNARVCLVEISRIRYRMNEVDYLCKKIKIVRELTIDEIVETLMFEGKSKEYIYSMYPYYQMEKGKQLTNVVINRPLDCTCYKGFDENMCAYNGYQFEVGKTYSIEKIVPNGNFYVYHNIRGNFDTEHTVFCEVEPIEINNDGNSAFVSCKKIRIVRYLTIEEIRNKLIQEGMAKKYANRIIAKYY